MKKLIVAIAVALVLVLPQVARAQDGPAIAVSPTPAHPGQPVTVSGTGFLAGEPVTIAFAGGTLATGVAGVDGSFTVTGSIPGDMPAGAHPLDAVGVEGSSASILYEVADQPAAAPPSGPVPAPQPGPASTPTPTPTTIATSRPAAAGPAGAPEPVSKSTPSPQLPSEPLEPAGAPVVDAGDDPRDVPAPDPVGETETELAGENGGEGDRSTGSGWFPVLVVLLGLLVLYGGSKLRGGNEDDDDDPRDLPPYVPYGEEIGDKVHTDVLHIHYWKADFASVVRRQKPVDDAAFPNEFVHHASEKASLLVVIEALDEHDERVGVEAYRIGSETNCDWTIDASKPGPGSVYDPDRITVEQYEQMVFEDEHERDSQEFKWLKQLASRTMYAGISTNLHYRLLGACAMFVEVPDDERADPFWAAVDDGLATMLDEALQEGTSALAEAAVGTAAGAVAGPVAGVVVAGLISGLSAFAESQKVEAEIVELPIHQRGEQRSSELPFLGVQRSPADAPFGTPPELWVRGAATATTTMTETLEHAQAEVAGQRHAMTTRSEIPIVVTRSCVVRLGVVRLEDETM